MLFVVWNQRGGMGYIRFSRLVICTFFVIAIACDGGDELPEGVVAKVGSRVIGMDDLVKGAQQMYGEQRVWAGLAKKQKTAVLEALVASQLLLVEGVSRGFDQEPSIRTELDDLQRKLLAETYFDRAVWRGLEVGDEKVLARFEEWGAGEQLHLAHILCRHRQAAMEVLQALTEGREFAALAREHSIHPDSAPYGGDMGYLRKGMLLPEIAAAVWDKPIGMVSEQPIQTPMGYHIIKVIERRRQSLQEQEPIIYRRIVAEEKLARQQVLWQQLSKKYALQWHGQIAALMAGHQVLPSVQDLYRWRGGALQASDYLRRAGVAQPVFRDTAKIRRLAERLVMAELTSLEARSAGYDTVAVVREPVERKLAELMARKLFAVQIAQPTPAQLQAFFVAHRSRYRGHEQVVVREILLDDAALADSLHALIVDGADMQQLAQRYTLRKELRQSGGYWADVEPGNPHSGAIYRLAQAGEGLLQPQRVPGGYSIIQVIAKKPGVQLEYHEAEKAILEDYTTVKMDEYIESLKTKYSVRIVLDRVHF